MADLEFPETLSSIETQNLALGGLGKGDRGVKGLGYKVLALRINPADYTATGVKVNTILSQIGWRSLFGVVGLSWATSPTGTPATWTIKPFLIVWDALNQTIRAYKGSAGALVEIAGADIATNDMVRCLFIGS